MVKVAIESTFESKPLEVLQGLVEKRAKVLRQTSEEAVTATAINILTSLKALTRKAPVKGNRKMYTIERTGLTAGWTRRAGVFRRVVRSGGIHGPIDWGVTGHCRDLVGKHYTKGESVGVFKMQLFNENCNNTLYYAYAKTEADARRYVEDVILARMLKKESGMAKYTVSIAQAKASNRPMTAEKSSNKQWATAYDAALLRSSRSGFSSGSFGIEFIDKLRYSLLALRGGRSAFEVAVKKAANRTAGLIQKANHDRLTDEVVQTPFPEVKGRTKA